MKTWKGVITHPGPHFEEDVGLFELREYGDIKYPGISERIKNRNILFLRENDFEMSAEEYEEAGWLLLGVGGGKFDEHATANNSGRKKGKCAAILVAEDLGIEKLPELKQVLQFALAADLNTFAKPLSPDVKLLRAVDPATTVNLLNRKNPDNPWIAIDWALLEIEARVWEQNEFYNIAPKEAMNAHKEIVGGFKVAIVESNCFSMEKYFRHKTDVTVQKSPMSGQVRIFTNNQVKIDMESMAKLFRLLEYKAQKRIGEIPKEDLIREGTIRDVPEWCYFKDGGSLMNGSHTAPNTPATKIPLEVITMAVRFVLLRSRNDKELNDFVKKFRV